MAKKTTDRKPDFVLSDGREVNFDFNAFSIGEWRAFLKNIKVETENDLIERAMGWESGNLDKLGVLDFRALTTKFYDLVMPSSGDQAEKN